MQNKNTERTEEYQSRLFGKRFRGATLAKSKIDTRSSGRIAGWLAKPKGFLLIWGPPGIGKTYICSALLESILPRYRSVRAYSERNLLRRIRSSFDQVATGDYLTVLHDLIDDEVIIIDDLGSSGYTEWREEILFEAVDFRYENTAPTVITTNLSPSEISSTYGRRIYSRLFAKENTIIDLSGLDDLREEGL